ncbi:hypothetical protein ACFOJ6_10485 [Gordonia humi]
MAVDTENTRSRNRCRGDQRLGHSELDDDEHAEADDGADEQGQQPRI